MIAANELRIGSTILINNKEKEPYYHNVSAHDIEEISECGNDCYPIPITPEILEKCGFVKEILEMSGCSVFTKGDSWRIAHKYRDGDNEFHLWHTQVSPPTWSLLSLNYLHQLQNLYFALTGTELNYTP